VLFFFFFFVARDKRKSLTLLPGVELDGLGELGRRGGEHGRDGVAGVERDLLGGDLWRKEE
jgi:hypothetical protein